MSGRGAHPLQTMHCTSNVCLQKQKAETAPEAEKPAKKQPASEESGDSSAAAALHNDIVAQGVFCVFCMTSTQYKQ